MNIKDYAKDCKVKFLYYRDGDLWYEVIGGPEKFKFPVPVHNRGEVGTAIFMAEDKALLFMRYIRKHIELIKAAKEKQEVKTCYCQKDNPYFTCNYCKDIDPALEKLLDGYEGNFFPGSRN